MTVHTRSFAIASVGMFQILLSFPVTYFFYRVVLNIHHFGTLQVLAVYVILGIGADDIFVLYDAFMQAPGEGACRLSFALRRAVSAMSVTSLTTFAAFVVTGLSPIMNIKVFGIFAALLVACNFLLCCLLTPILITLVHTGQCCGSGSCCRSKMRDAGVRDEGANDAGTKGKGTKEEGTKEEGVKEEGVKEEGAKGDEKKEKKELRIVEQFYNQKLSPFVVHYRWWIVLVGVGLIVGFGSQALLLAPSDKGIGDIWPDTHPVAVVSDMKSGIFLKGEAKYERIDVVYGITGIDRSQTGSFDPADKGTLLWNEQFVMDDVQEQQAMYNLCNVLKTQPYVHSIECFIHDLVRWRKYYGLSEFPIALKEQYYGNITAMMNMKMPVSNPPVHVLMKMNPHTQTTEEKNQMIEMMSLGKRHQALNTVRYNDEHMTSIRLSRIIVLLQHSWHAKVSIKVQERTDTQAIINQEHDKEQTPTSFSTKGILSSRGYVWMDTQLSLVESSLFGLSVAFILALVVLFIATSSLVVAMISILSIVGIVSVVLGMMVLMGRDLGFMESICVTVIVGLAVDYVVHIGISYTEHFHSLHTKNATAPTALSGGITNGEGHIPHHHTATTGAMTDLGVSVLGGATSSFGSALFLLMCVIKYLNQFGEFMALVIVTSLLFSSLIYPSMLAAVGDLSWEYTCKNKLRSFCCSKGKGSAEVAAGGKSTTTDVEMSSLSIGGSTKKVVPEGSLEDPVVNNGAGKDGELSNTEIMNWNSHSSSGGLAVEEEITF